MKEDCDEPIRAYGARLRGQAGVCKYTLSCPGCNHDVHYTDAILRDVLCRGLADNEIQMDLLGDSNQDMTLEQVLRFVEEKEAGKRSAAHLLIFQAADHVAGSSYKRQKKLPPRNQQGPDQDSCTCCSTKGHGKNAPTRTRRSECPAFGTQCGHCGRDHHYERVCRAKHNKNHTAPSGRTLSSTLYVTSPPKPMPEPTPWTTTSTTKPHGAGPGGSPNHNPLSGYRCTPPGRTTIISDTH